MIGTFLCFICQKIIPEILNLPRVYTRRLPGVFVWSWNHNYLTMILTAPVIFPVLFSVILLVAGASTVIILMLLPLLLLLLFKTVLSNILKKCRSLFLKIKHTY